MFKNYLLVAWRNLLRFKKVSFINITGLAIGITACLFIFMVVRYENSFDTFQPDYNRIYRVVTQTNYETGIQYNSGVSDGVPDAMRTEFPQIEKLTALSALFDVQLSLPGGKEKFAEHNGIYFLEPAFFDLFHSKWLAGKPAVLSAPDVIVLNKTSATKYFGDWKKAMGQVLMLDVKTPVKVAGVVEDAPANTDFPLKIILSYETFKKHEYGYQENSWQGMNGGHQVFVLLPQKVSAAKIDQQLKDFSKSHYQNQTISARNLFLLPLKDNHFDARLGYIVPRTVSRTTLYTLSFIGLLILIMAVINFVNLTTAQTVERAKEIGIRKTLGSRRWQLIGQLLTETFFIVLSAVLLSLVFATFSAPLLKQITEVPVNIINGNNLQFLGLLLVIVTLLAGIYPAFILSGLKPLAALKNKLTAGANGRLSVRRGLVVTQFVISQVLIVATIVAMSQLQLLRDTDLGFDKEALLLLSSPKDKDAFKSQLLQQAGVASVTLASNPPATDDYWRDNFYLDHTAQTAGFNIDIKCGDTAYLKTFGLHLLAGRNYYESAELVINETFAKKLGFHTPAAAIGHMIKVGDQGSWCQVVGVVKDFVSYSLRDELKPTVIMPLKDSYQYICVKLQPAHFMSTVERIRHLWEAFSPEYTYNGYFLDQNIAAYYRQEQHLTLLYKLFAGIAIFISCLGLYGLVSFMAIQKRKEIGIRKVLGATVNHILYLFCKEFVVLVFIAFVIAAPLSWFAMDNWLQGFTHRVHIGAAVFLTALLVSATIALITVGHKAVRAAWTNPVKSLRMD
jgi:putative ABC transport system permease protein